MAQVTARDEAGSVGEGYVGWVTVSARKENFSVSNGTLSAFSDHHFEARNYTNTDKTGHIRYESILEELRNGQWVQAAPNTHDSIGPDSFTLEAQAVFNDEDQEHDEGAHWTFRRRTSFGGVQAGDQFRLKTYTRLQCDGHDSCKAEQTTSPVYVVPDN